MPFPSRLPLVISTERRNPATPQAAGSISRRFFLRIDIISALKIFRLRVSLWNDLLPLKASKAAENQPRLNSPLGYLSERRIPFVITEEPGGTPIGRKIREMLLNNVPRDTANMSAETELLLFCAARAQHIKEVIGPALKEGRVVLCDRFSDATIAYQGFGRGLDIDFIRRINDFSSAGLKPHFTLLFDLPVETGLRRAMERIAGNKGMPAEDRFEREALEFHRRVREGYLVPCGRRT